MLEHFYIENLHNRNYILHVVTNVRNARVYYSYDGNTYTVAKFNDRIMYSEIKVKPLSKVYIAGDIAFVNKNRKSEIPLSVLIRTKCKYNAGGDVSWLYNFDKETNTAEPILDLCASNVTMERMFLDNFVEDASNLVLPALKLSQGCYDRMFEGTTLLKGPKELPATDLAINCYRKMFSHSYYGVELPNPNKESVANMIGKSLLRNLDGKRFDVNDFLPTTGLSFLVVLEECVHQIAHEMYLCDSGETKPLFMS